jgi:hypothetical protein
MIEHGVGVAKLHELPAKFLLRRRDSPMFNNSDFLDRNEILHPDTL